MNSSNHPHLKYHGPNRMPERDKDVCPLCQHKSIKEISTVEFHSVSPDRTRVLNKYWSGIKCQLCRYSDKRFTIR